jgi:hypothetical protein
MLIHHQGKEAGTATCTGNQALWEAFHSAMK